MKETFKLGNQTVETTLAKIAAVRFNCIFNRSLFSKGNEKLTVTNGEIRCAHCGQVPHALNIAEILNQL